MLYRFIVPFGFNSLQYQQQYKAYLKFDLSIFLCAVYGWLWKKIKIKKEE